MGKNFSFCLFSEIFLKEMLRGGRIRSQNLQNIPLINRDLSEGNKIKVSNIRVVKPFKNPKPDNIDDSQISSTKNTNELDSSVSYELNNKKVHHKTQKGNSQIFQTFNEKFAEGNCSKRKQRESRLSQTTSTKELNTSVVSRASRHSNFSTISKQNLKDSTSRKSLISAKNIQYKKNGSN